MMKRIFGLCALLFCCLMLLTACGGSSAPRPAALSSGELLTALQDSQAFTAEMKEMAQAQLLRYLAIEENQLFAAAMSMDASRETPEAIVVLDAADASQVQPLQAALELYLQDMMEQYRDYRPLEMPKLESAVLRTVGTRLVLVIGPDAAATEKVLDEQMGK